MPEDAHAVASASDATSGDDAAPDAFRDEPLALWARPADGAEGVDARELVFTSRGDRVPARLWLPAGAVAGTPLVLLLRDAAPTSTGDDAARDAAVRAWARGGAAVLALDLPLHGARAEGKWSQRLRSALAPGAEADAGARALLDEFARQALADLHRALDAAGRLPGVDAGRVVCAGCSLAALVVAAFCARDPRPGAVALALPASAGAARELEAARHVGRIAPRPLLCVGDPDARDASVALHAAAGEPKRILWLEETPRAETATAALEAMQPFLRAQLGLAEPGSGDGAG